MDAPSQRLDKEMLDIKLEFVLFVYYRLQSTELQMKSEVATVRLRYEQQVKNLSGELTSMQVKTIIYIIY